MQILKYFLALSSLLIVFSCNKDSSAAGPLEDNWSLIHLSGGIAGFDCELAAGDYQWNFEEDQLIRTVINESSCFTFITKDTFKYSILEDTGREFLELNDQVFGEMIISNDSLFIDTNKHPNGSGADGFAYTLVK